MNKPVDLAALAERVLRREPPAVARAISHVEDRRLSAEPGAIALLRELMGKGRAEKSHRIGITGPPGVGKSSLVSALLRLFRASGRSVGVLAVDPSSPRSGGALLGDRARIETDPDDGDAFVRSMASGGQLGGLARAAGAAIDVLGSTYEVVLIETTGVGQSETDVEHVADTVLLVIQPASGDVLQFIKAGILEIPDLFTVNKSDLGAPATRALAELRAALSVAAEAREAHASPPILSTSSLTGDGLEALVAALDGRWGEISANRAHLSRRIDKTATWALRLFTQRYGEMGVERAGGASVLHALFHAELEGGATTLEIVRNAAIEAGLRDR